MSQRRRPLAALRLVPLLVAGLAVLLPVPAAAAAGGGQGAWLPPLEVEARFVGPGTYNASALDGSAVTYDPASVPVGSRATVREWANEWGGMSVRLDLEGLRPRAVYQAYLGAGRCTPQPGTLGPPFEDNPASGVYPANEFFFATRADATGAARAVTQHYWGISTGQHARSVVVLRPGLRRAVACANVPFRRLNPGW
jgi:hypothetical protein